MHIAVEGQRDFGVWAVDLKIEDRIRSLGRMNRVAGSRFYHEVKIARRIEEGEPVPHYGFVDIVIEQTNASAPKSLSLDTQVVDVEVEHRLHAVACVPYRHGGGNHDEAE